MRIPVILCLFFLSSLTIFGQMPFNLPNDITKNTEKIPKGLRNVIQFSNDTLLNVRYYDRNGREIFSYYRQYVHENWNGLYITIISGKEYDDQGRITRSCFLHSNIGFTINYFEYDSLGNNIRVLERKNIYANDPKLTNQNPFRYIEHWTSPANLISQEKFIDMIYKAPKRLIALREFDKGGNMLHETQYNDTGQVYTHENYIYNEFNQPVYYRIGLNKEEGSEYFYEYGQNISEIVDLNGKKKPGVLLQCTRLLYDDDEKRKHVYSTVFYNYDSNRNITSEIEYHSGKFESKQLSKFNNNNLLIERIHFITVESEIHSKDIFEYNNEGYVISEATTEYTVTGQNETTITKYEYQYSYYR